MTTQKRGLGRGLEALLVDVSAKETRSAVLVKAIQTENANLIKEAEALKVLLDDFETLVRNLNIDKSTL
jgi:ParB-like chromosome segregation protein Spo0J